MSMEGGKVDRAGSVVGGRREMGGGKRKEGEVRSVVASAIVSSQPLTPPSLQVMKAGGVRHCNTMLIAECLNTRLLILQHMFQLAGCGPTSIPLRIANKVVACAQTPVPFRNAIKRSCLGKVVYAFISVSCPGTSHLMVVIRPQRCSVLGVSLFYSGVITAEHS